MTNPEKDPTAVVCESEPAPAVEVIAPRDVPLGGLRAMNVRRTLPTRGRSLIGAWCFLDHYGPDDVATSGGMSVARHPHTGLQTVSWLFTGEIEHRDSAGNHAMVRPGEVNLMTAGRGISHSEFSTPGTTTLHGAQLWVALPDAQRHREPGFEHHRPEPVTGEGWEARVFLGSLLGSTSPVRTHTPLVGAEVLVRAGSRVVLDVDPGHEHGVLLDAGAVTVDGHAAKPAELVYLPTGADRVEVVATSDSRLLVIGGEPLGEQILMWWNFVGRSHEEVVAYREQWMAEISEGASAGPTPLDGDAERFGPFPDGQPEPIPAPPLPGGRLRPRG